MQGRKIFTWPESMAHERNDGLSLARRHRFGGFAGLVPAPDEPCSTQVAVDAEDRDVVLVRFSAVEFCCTDQRDFFPAGWNSPTERTVAGAARDARLAFLHLQAAQIDQFDPGWKRLPDGGPIVITYRACPLPGQHRAQLYLPYFSIVESIGVDHDGKPVERLRALRIPGFVHEIGHCIGSRSASLLPFKENDCWLRR